MQLWATKIQHQCQYLPTICSFDFQSSRGIFITSRIFTFSKPFKSLPLSATSGSRQASPCLVQPIPSSQRILMLVSLETRVARTWSELKLELSCSWSHMKVFKKIFGMIRSNQSLIIQLNVVCTNIIRQNIMLRRWCPVQWVVQVSANFFCSNPL